MSKLFPLFVLTTVFGMTSYAPAQHRVTCECETLINTILSMRYEMADQGYEYTGYDTSYEKLITHISDKVQQATTYRFVDSLGNTMEYLVVFREKTVGREQHAYDVDYCVCKVGDCKVNDPKEYERLCDIAKAVGQLFPQANTYKSVPKQEMEDAVSLVQSQLASQGFRMTGKSNLKHYDEITNGWQTNTFHFLDSVGNTADVSIRHLNGVYGVELCDCVTSNPDDVEKICGEEGVVKQLKELSKGQKASRVPDFQSIVLTTGCVLGLALTWILVILPKL